MKAGALAELRPRRAKNDSRRIYGGGRVVYIHHDADHPIFLLAAFAKNKQGQSQQGRAETRWKFVKTLFKPTGGNV